MYIYIHIYIYVIYIYIYIHINHTRTLIEQESARDWIHWRETPRQQREDRELRAKAAAEVRILTVLHVPDSLPMWP